MNNEVLVKKGDWVRALKDHRSGTTKGAVYRVIHTDQHYWYTINDQGYKKWFQNPLSRFFELDKRSTVLEIIKDL